MVSADCVGFCNVISEVVLVEGGAELHFLTTQPSINCTTNASICLRHVLSPLCLTDFPGHMHGTYFGGYMGTSGVEIILHFQI